MGNRKKLWKLTRFSSAGISQPTRQNIILKLGKLSLSKDFFMWWPLYCYFHQKFTVIMNYLRRLDTTLRTLNTWYNIIKCILWFSWFLLKTRNTQGELVLIFPTLCLSLLSNSPQRMCVGVHVLNMFLFFVGMMGNFGFLQVPCFVARNFYRFKNEGHLL